MNLYRLAESVRLGKDLLELVEADLFVRKANNVDHAGVVDPEPERKLLVLLGHFIHGVFPLGLAESHVGAAVGYYIAALWHKVHLMQRHVENARHSKAKYKGRSEGSLPLRGRIHEILDNLGS